MGHIRRRRRELKKIFLVLAVVGLLAAAVLPASPAQAAGAGVAVCNVSVNPWPGTGSNAPCVGTATGAFTDGTGTPFICAPSCPLNASVDSYGETCVAGEPPLVGTASGTLSINNGQLAPTYNWSRVGLVAVITTAGPTGAGVAAFIPVDTTIPSCAAPGQLDVTVAGLALFT
jgi:hypothetical protein